MVVTTAEVTRVGFLDMQVCVPKDWSDEQVVQFANLNNSCGTKNGWFIRRKDDSQLDGDSERIPCAGGRENFVHIMLDA